MDVTKYRPCQVSHDSCIQFLHVSVSVSVMDIMSGIKTIPHNIKEYFGWIHGASKPVIIHHGRQDVKVSIKIIK